MKNKTVIPLLLMLIKGALLSLLWSPSAWSACALKLPGGDTNLKMTLVRDFSLGRIVTPDAGNSGFVQVTPDDARTISGELYIGDRNTTATNDTYATAEVEVTGAPDCSYRLSLNGALPSRVSSVQASIDGGARGSFPRVGKLSATGTSRVKFLLRVLVYDTDVSDIAGNISLRANWLGY